MPEVSVQQDTKELAKPRGAVDIAIGVLSYNNAGAIGTVMRAAQDTLAMRLPGKRSVVVLADGGSKDGTPENALAAANKDDFVQIAYTIYPAQKISPGCLRRARKNEWHSGDIRCRHRDECHGVRYCRFHHRRSGARLD